MITLSHSQKHHIGFTYVMELTKPASPYGREALRHLQPAVPGEAAQLETELDNVERALHALPAIAKQVEQLEHLFHGLRDIRGSIGRCGSDALSEVDLFEIKRFLLQLGEIAALTEQIQAVTGCHGLQLGDTSDALELLDPDGSRIATFYIGERYAPALSAIREAKRQVEGQLRATTDAEEQTALVKRRGELVAQEQMEEDAARVRLSQALLPYVATMLQNVDVIGRMDLTLQKAKLAAQYGACRPRIGGDGVRFVEMINPQVADRLTDRGGHFTPLTLQLRRGATVITGANMGGKSVALKTTALSVLLIHCGFFPFAREADCALFDAMHIISEDLEAADRGLSTFGGEIVHLQEVLQDMAGGFALVLMDEFARGTNPEEGAAIARGVTAHMNSRRGVTLMVTHYEGVAGLAGAHYQVVGLDRVNPDALAAQIAGMPGEARVAHIAGLMDYDLVPVTADREPPREALTICRLLGLDEKIVKLIEKHYKST